LRQQQLLQAAVLVLAMCCGSCSVVQGEQLQHQQALLQQA
jgi:hypothetical protein